jgi:DNA-binding GntR family transcriptional regulator
MPDGNPLPAARTAYAALRERILSNYYTPGQSVSITEVTAALAMSRTPLRDALIRLEEERLIELVPRQGFRVLPLPPGAMRESYEVLAGLEVAAIELLTTRGPDQAERAALAEVSEALGLTLEEQDLDAWAVADARFHDLILSAGLRPLPEASTRAHQALVAAILAGDATSARDIHLRQRLRSARELTEILERLNIRAL